MGVIKQKQRKRGFTIVELMIVIVVIAILAAISIVAYTGIQNRANLTAATNNLRQINTAIQLYHAENGHYPRLTTETAHRVASDGIRLWAFSCREDPFLPELADIVTSLPDAPCNTHQDDQDRDAWVYFTNHEASEYKLLYIHPEGLDSVADSIDENLRDERRWETDPSEDFPTYSFGWWSDGASWY